MVVCTYMKSLPIESGAQIKKPSVPAERRKCHDCTKPAILGRSRCQNHVRVKPTPKPPALPWWVAESRACVRSVCRTIFIPVCYSQKSCSHKCGLRARAVYMRRYTKQYRVDHPDWAVAQDQRSAQNQTAKRRGISENKFESRIAEQNNLCPIGNHPFVGRGQGKYAPARDHCHVTGLDRAILCSEHNRALGGMQDSPEVLRRAADYVEYWRIRHQKLS